MILQKCTTFIQNKNIQITNMFTYEWKTYEQLTDYEKVLFSIDKNLYFGHKKHSKGIVYYYVLYKDGKLY